VHPNYNTISFLAAAAGASTTDPLYTFSNIVVTPCPAGMYNNPATFLWYVGTVICACLCSYVY
jgi:hypothetical protein